MIKWRPFFYKDKTYDLSHLHPFEMTLLQSASNDKPAREYQFVVSFGLHSFTRKVIDSEKNDPALHYKDSRETRVFCFHRYEHSKYLPTIIKTVEKRKCYHTGHSNYFIIELITQEKNIVEYEVYFAVSKSGQQKGKLNLFIQSAYTRDEIHKRGQPKKKPIRFQIIAFNTLIGKPIKAPI